MSSYVGELLHKVLSELALPVLVGIVFGVCIVILLLRWLFSAKRPRTFRCARCRRETPHDHRTIEAWRTGKHKFFCPECHCKWRESHPAVHVHEFTGGGGGGGGGGCILPLALIFSVLSLGAYAAVSLVW